MIKNIAIIILTSLLAFYIIYGSYVNGVVAEAHHGQMQHLEQKIESLQKELDSCQDGE